MLFWHCCLLNFLFFTAVLQNTSLIFVFSESLISSNVLAKKKHDEDSCFKLETNSSMSAVEVEVPSDESNELTLLRCVS